MIINERCSASNSFILQKMGVPGLRHAAQECAIRKRWALDSKVDSNAHEELVVDGNALVYHTYFRAAGPWIFGGDTIAFRRELDGIIHTLRKVFRRIHILMDGPKQEAKWPLSIRRANEAIRRVKDAFERGTGGGTGGGGGRGGDFGVLSPLYLAWSVDFFRELAAEMPTRISFAVSWQNADREIAQWAMKNRAWVISNDSDFFVYAGHAGYLPLEDFGFPAAAGSASASASAPSTVGTGDEDEDDRDQSDLCAIAYYAKDVANRFSIPATLLPLLVSLAGNDYISSTSNSSKSLKALAQEIRALFPRRRAPDSRYTTTTTTTTTSITTTTDPHLVLEAYAKRYRMTAGLDQVRISMAQYELSEELRREHGEPCGGRLVERERRWASLGTDISYRWMDVVRYGRFWCTPIVENLALPSLWLFFRPLRCLCYRMLDVQRVQEVIRMEKQMVEQWVDVTQFEVDLATARWIELLRTCPLDLDSDISLVDQFLVWAIRYMVLRQQDLPFALNDLDLLSLLFCSRPSVACNATATATATATSATATTTTTTTNTSPIASTALMDNEVPLASVSNCTVFSAFLLAIEHTLSVLRFLATESSSCVEATEERSSSRIAATAISSLRLTSIPLSGKVLHVVRSRLKGGTPWTTFLPDLQAQAHIRSLYAKITDGCEIETVFR